MITLNKYTQNKQSSIFVNKKFYIMKKQFLLLLTLLFLTGFTGWGQTTLSTGDIAIIGMDTGAEDFMFVTFVDLQAGTEIYFTDNPATATNPLATAEGTVLYTAPTAISAGTVIVRDDSNTGFTTTTDGDLALGNSGDNLIAYQGTLSNPTVYLHSVYNASPGTFPSGFTNYVSISDDDGEYSGGRTGGVVSTYVSNINNSSNWTVNGSGVVPFDTTNFVIGGASSPEINIKGNGNTIIDGATLASSTNHTDFGTVATNTDVVRTFTIENTGSANLVLTAPYVQLTSGGQGFTITQQPALTTIIAGSSTTFEVTFNSATAGTFTEGIEVLSNDTDEANYSFDIQAIAEAPTPEINIKGNNNSIAMGDASPSTTDHTDFGSAITNENIVRTFTIENTGTGVLTINDILMNTGTKYTIGGITLPTTVAASSSTTFTVTLNSATAGTFTDTVLIHNDDANESTYDFAVTGTANTVNFSVGDISIVGVTADAPDSFAFVNWVDIPNGAKLSFTDNGYNGSTLLNNENTILWENNTGIPIPAGTVIKFTDNGTDFDLGTKISGTFDGFSASDDTILIYEGNATTPHYIFGLSMRAWVSTGVINTNNSYLPASLNVANGNIVVGTLDNNEYNKSRDNQELFSEYRALVNNPVNWTGNNSNFAISSTDFTLCPWWNGTVWSNGTGPNSSTSGVIKGTYNTGSNGAIVANDLSIKTDGLLTVAASNPITVHGSIYNLTPSSITVENNGTILQPNNTATNLNTGNISYNRTTPALAAFDFVYWSTPVAGQNLQNIGFATGNQYNYLFNSDSSVYNWIGINTASGYTMANGIGYATRNTATSTAGASKTFTGVPNNGDIPVTIKSNGETTASPTQKLANLIGNPYPSAINIVNFYNDNSAKMHRTFNIWTHNSPYESTTNSYDTDDYLVATINPDNTTVDVVYPSGLSSYNGHIAAGQAFFINGSNNGTDTVTFKNSQRVGANNNQFYRNATNNTVEVNSFKLNISNPLGFFKQTYIGYSNITTNDFDNQYDYAYPVGANENRLYTVLGNSLLGFQYKAPFVNTDEVVLGFNNTVAGEFKMELDSPSAYFDNQDIFVKDNLLNTYHNLKVSPYIFTEPTGVNTSRFKIVYQNPLGINNHTIEEILVYKNENMIFAKAGNNKIATVKIFDISGRLLVEKNNINDAAFSYNASQFSQQILLVQVTTKDNKTWTKKVL
jgi:trimeric autotransporter adhesin